MQVFWGGVDDTNKASIKDIIGFEEGQLPVRYLRVPLTSKRINITHYFPLIEKIVVRIRHWTSKLLNYAGRIQLIRSMAFAITQYWLQCFHLPKFVLTKIDVIYRNFL